MSANATDRYILKLQTFMAVAADLSVLSTCDRKQVGAIFVRDGRCVTWGFNGAPPGMPHCDENGHGWGEQERNLGIYGCRNVIHAEANALAFAARHGISTDDTTLFVTVSPCLDCSKLLVAAGVAAVFYKEEYRDRAGLELLERAGIDYGTL